MIHRPTNIAACAIQLGLIRPDGLRIELSEEIKYIKENSGGNVDLLVFPEYHGLLLQLLATGNDPRTTGVPEILDLNLHKKMDDLFSFYAEIALSLKTNVVTGSYLLEKKDRRYMSVGIFDRKGNLAGYQNKTHTNDFDSRLGVSRGIDLSVIECDAGRIGVMMGEDRFIPEVSRDLSLRGTNIFVSPCSSNIRMNVFQQACGLWRQVQSEQIYGIESYLVGTLLNSTYYGSSAIIFPVEISHDRSGFQRISDHAGLNQVIREELDFIKLQGNIEAYPIYFSLNFDLYRSKLMGAYEKLEKFSGLD
jgi:predicted amidohydrolase